MARGSAMHAEARRNERGLGRGLASLIPVREPAYRQERRASPLADIRPNPQQPRLMFAEDAPSSLIDSVAEHGVLQPVLVVAADEGFVLIAGERRVRAARAAGLVSSASTRSFVRLTNKSVSSSRSWRTSSARTSTRSRRPGRSSGRSTSSASRRSRSAGACPLHGRRSRTRCASSTSRLRSSVPSRREGQRGPRSRPGRDR